MREILFRGKREDNGEWVYGSFLKMEVGGNPVFCIIPCAPLVKSIIKGDGIYQVDPSTVGQYTGLTDKNNTKIFEGDILRVSKYRKTYLSKIVFNEKTAGFEFWWRFTCGAYGEWATGMYNMAQFEDVEVIGNVHDNPEILEVKK